MQMKEQSKPAKKPFALSRSLTAKEIDSISGAYGGGHSSIGDGACVNTMTTYPDGSYCVCNTDDCD